MDKKPKRKGNLKLESTPQESVKSIQKPPKENSQMKSEENSTTSISKTDLEEKFDNKLKRNRRAKMKWNSLEELVKTIENSTKADSEIKIEEKVRTSTGSKQKMDHNLNKNRKGKTKSNYTLQESDNNIQNLPKVVSQISIEDNSSTSITKTVPKEEKCRTTSLTCIDLNLYDERYFDDEILWGAHDLLHLSKNEDTIEIQKNFKKDYNILMKTVKREEHLRNLMARKRSILRFRFPDLKKTIEEVEELVQICSSYGVQFTYNKRKAKFIKEKIQDITFINDFLKEGSYGDLEMKRLIKTYNLPLRSKILTHRYNCLKDLYQRYLKTGNDEITCQKFFLEYFLHFICRKAKNFSNFYFNFNPEIDSSSDFNLYLLKIIHPIGNEVGENIYFSQKDDDDEFDLFYERHKKRFAFLSLTKQKSYGGLCIPSSYLGQPMFDMFVDPKFPKYYK